VKLKKGDTFTSYPSGGGGWGNPLERDAELVRMDAKNEIISLKSAYKDYGVVLEEKNYKIDCKETTKFRKIKKSGGKK